MTWYCLLKSNAIDFCNLLSHVHKASFASGGNYSLNMRVLWPGEGKAYQATVIIHDWYNGVSQPGSFAQQL